MIKLFHWVESTVWEVSFHPWCFGVGIIPGGIDAVEELLDDGRVNLAILLTEKFEADNEDKLKK